MTFKYHKGQLSDTTEVQNMAIIGSLGFVQVPDKLIVRLIDVNSESIRQNADDTTIARRPRPSRQPKKI